MGATKMLPRATRLHEMHPIALKQKLTFTLIFILGDYSPTPSSLIGALAINLGISVRNLSKDKEEDLRRQYFCWWSRPLPEEHSFRRILCFEGGFGSRGSTPPRVVGAVFRCLVPILSGEDSKGGSVIMPLLASGDQVFHKWIESANILESLQFLVLSLLEEGEYIRCQCY